MKPEKNDSSHGLYKLQHNLVPEDNESEIFGE
jgi:hypothetical protein